MLIPLFHPLPRHIHFVNETVKGFSSLFNKEVIGIVTKIDMAEQPEQIEKARRQLKAAGAKEIFEISATENEGIDRLQAYLEAD